MKRKHITYITLRWSDPDYCGWTQAQGTGITTTNAFAEQTVTVHVMIFHKFCKMLKISGVAARKLLHVLLLFSIELDCGSQKSYVLQCSVLRPICRGQHQSRDCIEATAQAKSKHVVRASAAETGQITVSRS